MRIAVTGTHSVGKTTFINDLIAHFQNEGKKVTLINEVARDLIKKGFKITPLTEYGIVHYMKSYLELERNAKGKLIISDRSLLDLLSYITVDQSPSIRSAYLDLIHEVWLMEKSRFDMYFYIPVEFGLTQDGSRSSDEKYRLAVDKQIVDFLQQFDLKYVTIKGNRKKRVKTSLKSLYL
ncbi:MAG: ATP-binding protein [Bacteroidetes bacterium]|nr:ATP-binding protein [Bacteroidota bacterium]